MKPITKEVQELVHRAEEKERERMRAAALVRGKYYMRQRVFESSIAAIVARYPGEEPTNIVKMALAIADMAVEAWAPIAAVRYQGSPDEW